MSHWILFLAGLVVFLAFSAVLTTFFLGSFTAGVKRYLLGRIIGGAIKGTTADREATHRMLGALGLQTQNGGPADAELERLRPQRWQEILAWICYLGIALGFGLMAYAMMIR